MSGQGLQVLCASLCRQLKCSLVPFFLLKKMERDTRSQIIKWIHRNQHVGRYRMIIAVREHRFQQIKILVECFGRF